MKVSKGQSQPEIVAAAFLILEAGSGITTILIPVLIVIHIALETKGRLFTAQADSTCMDDLDPVLQGMIKGLSGTEKNRLGKCLAKRLLSTGKF